MQNFFIVVHSGYKWTTIAIFSHNTTNAFLVEKNTIANQQASKLITQTIKELLEKNNLALHDCQFIAAYQGPAPFTSLRTGLTTVNGLAFAATIPTIGLDGLTTHVLEISKKTKTTHTLVMLNAFCNDVYYALHNRKTHKTITGWGNATTVCNDIAKQLEPDSNITIAGNALALHKETIGTCLKKVNVTIYDQEECSLQALADMALYRWKNQDNITAQVMPLYLKPSSAKLNKRS